MKLLVILLAHYLRNNPLASDTAEGIARWWLAPGTDTEATRQALDVLIRSGVVQTVNANDGKVRYRRAPGGAEIDVLLDEVITGKPPQEDHEDSTLH